MSSRQLLAFRGSFSADAARAVAGSAADLTCLRERGLLVPLRVGPAPRLRLLETVRAIAGDPDPDAVERHTRWYAALAARWFAETHGLASAGPDEDPEADELLHAAARALDRPDLPDVAELLGYALLVARRTRRSEARALADAALARTLPPRARVRVLHAVAASPDWDPAGALFRTLPDEALSAGLPEVAVDV